MLSGLVAEIGNHHFGDIEKAKELIRVAKECGASFVKMQAIDPIEFIAGSMDGEFYSMCDLGLSGYLECVDYGDSIDVPVFFSVFGTKYATLPESLGDRPYKISGSQFQTFTHEVLQFWNLQNQRPVIISVPKTDEIYLEDRRECVSNMNVMYVTPYLPGRVDFTTIERYVELFKKPIGYSDHSVGIGNCRVAISQYGCQLIEKHFNLYGVQAFGGKTYRDSLHAANAYQLERLAKYL